MLGIPFCRRRTFLPFTPYCFPQEEAVAWVSRYLRRGRQPSTTIISVASLQPKAPRSEALHGGGKIGELSLTSPPSRPCLARQTVSGNTHSCRRMPPIPRGLSALWPGAATNPSSDIEILKRSLDTPYLLPPPTAAKFITLRYPSPSRRPNARRPRAPVARVFFATSNISVPPPSESVRPRVP
jgi:hypothetical protein